MDAYNWDSVCAGCAIRFSILLCFVRCFVYNARTLFTYTKIRTHCRNIRRPISTDIFWRVFRILTEPVPYRPTFVSVNRRNNEPGTRDTLTH